MKNKIKYFIIIAAAGVLLLPTPTQAILGVGDFGIFDYFDTALGGIEEVAGPVVKNIVQILFAYVISLIAFYLSGYFFQTVITSTPQWLSINTNPMVLSGWNFISGIANMFIILILIWIALSFILERDTDAMKKALPRLIMIALLMNFSLVFVGGLVDISNIIYKTLLIGNEYMILDIANNLGIGIWGVVTTIFSWLTLLAIAYLVPFIAPFKQFGLVVGLITILPNVFTWIAQIASALFLSSLFFLYTFLFSARVFIIQILAIISPLAFLTYVLPQTKKYWTEWLKHLIEWMFLGISLLFLLIIGMRASNWIVPDVGANPPTFLGWIYIADYISYYFFLIVYLGIISFISVKSMPTMAQSIIDQGKAVGKMAVSRVVKPIGRQAGMMARQAAITQEKVEEKWKDVKGLKGWVGRRYAGARKAIAVPTRWAYRMAGTTPEMAAMARKESKTARAEETKKKVEGQTEQIQRAELQAALKSKDDSRTVGVMGAMLKDRNLEKADKDGFFGKEGVEKYIEEANKMGIKTLNSYDPAKTAKILNPEKWEATQELIEQGAEWEGKEVQKEMISEVLAKMKPSDVKLMSGKALTNDILKEVLVDTFNGNQMAEVGKNFGRDIIDGIQGEITSRGTAKKIAEKNPDLVLWLHGNAAQNLGLSLPGEEDLKRKEIKKIVSNARKGINILQKLPEKERRLILEYSKNKEMLLKMMEEGKKSVSLAEETNRVWKAFPPKLKTAWRELQRLKRK